jgi:hypothetical protein
MNWMLDNYKNYWGQDVDLATANVAYGFVTVSTVPDLVMRTNTAIDVLKERMGEDLPIFVADCVATAVSESGAYDALAPVLAAHPEYEYWFIFSICPTSPTAPPVPWKQAGKDDKAFMTCAARPSSLRLWRRPAMTVLGRRLRPEQISVRASMLTGLIALRDGRATYESLWADTRRPCDFATPLQPAHPHVHQGQLCGHPAQVEDQLASRSLVLMPFPVS